MVPTSLAVVEPSQIHQLHIGTTSRYLAHLCSELRSEQEELGTDGSWTQSCPGSFEVAEVPGRDRFAGFGLSDGEDRSVRWLDGSTFPLR